MVGAGAGSAGANIAGAGVSALELAEARRWSQQADVALTFASDTGSPTEPAPAVWVSFWLHEADLEILLEAALVGAGDGPVLLAGARAGWNPLRPPYDRIFAVDLWDEDGHWEPVRGGLLSVVMPLRLYRQLAPHLRLWLRALTPFSRSGRKLARLQPLSGAGGAELVAQWRQSLVAQPPADESFGFHWALNPGVAVWFGRSSLHGWLIGLIALLLMLVVLALLLPVRVRK